MDSDGQAIEDKKSSALSRLGALPKIGNRPFGFGGDIGLGFAHNFALDIAREVLSDLSEQALEKLYNSLMKIFIQWKYEHGLKFTPTTLPTLGSILGGIIVSPKELTEEERLLQIKSLEPWKCHKDAKTPVALFNSLLYENYKPLKDYLYYENNNYDHMQALLILLTHKPDEEYQSSDCIYEATKLALWQLQHKNGLVKKLIPDAMAMWMAREKSKQVRKSKKAEKDTATDEKVMAAYKTFCKDGKAPSAIQRHIQRETHLNQTEVSRSMARLGLSTRKRKNCRSK